MLAHVVIVLQAVKFVVTEVRVQLVLTVIMLTDQIHVPSAGPQDYLPAKVVLMEAHV